MAAAIDGMEDIVQEFLIESAEGVDALDRDLVALERQPGSPELLAEIFRVVHTIKGNSGALGYLKLESVAHAGENLLAALREGELSPNPELMHGLLRMVDALRGLLSAIERSGNEANVDYRPVVDLLTGLDASRRLAKPAEEQAEPPLDAPGGTLSVSRLPASLQASEEIPQGQDTRRASIRVAVGVLDRLMNLVGELVLARNQVQHLAARNSDATLTRVAQRLKAVTGDLQESVMKARLQPVGHLWNKLPRLARDMAAQCGKQIELHLHGSETEMDRTVLEAIRDPLTHLLRNAVDHGVETAGKRMLAGKSAAGHLRLDAFHEAGRVHVEVADDGAGIDLARVRHRAVERGLITSEQAEAMSEPDITNLVFHPGFSTSATVTNLSGRGVGLDVVRTNVERVGGTVEIENRPGQGVTVKINLPLTLAILPALMVSSGRAQFAIPQGSLVELVRLEVGREPNPIEHVCGEPVYRLRDRLLSLVFLDRLLGLPEQNSAVVHLAVLEAGIRRFGLVVDAVGDTEELVVKPLDSRLQGLTCFTGAAIPGDGKPVLILDVAAVARSARLSTDVTSLKRKESAGIQDYRTAAKQSWLIFRSAGGSRLALPTSAIVRLEELSAQRVERSCGGEIVQCRGEIMPLLRLSELLHEPLPEGDLLQVLVLHNGEKNVGLVVDRIEDIVDEAVQLPTSGQGGGLVQGLVVMQKRVAGVLDPENLRARVDWLGGR